MWWGCSAFVGGSPMDLWHRSGKYAYTTMHLYPPLSHSVVSSQAGPLPQTPASPASEPPMPEGERTGSQSPRAREDESLMPEGDRTPPTPQVRFAYVHAWARMCSRGCLHDFVHDSRPACATSLCVFFLVVTQGGRFDSAPSGMASLLRKVQSMHNCGRVDRRVCEQLCTVDCACTTHGTTPGIDGMYRPFTSPSL